MKNHHMETSFHHTALDRLFRYAEFLNFGEVHFKFDHSIGLRAIIAVHNLKRGPAIGGCRLVHYSCSDDALEDALRLAYMMSLKSAVSNLPHGGAKAVLIHPKEIKDRKKYLEAYADFVNELNGRYVTAIDSGTYISDMDVIAGRTRYVTCTTAMGDPSIYTAIGVKRGIEAAVKFHLGRDDLQDIHVVIQGAGHVGYFLAKELKKVGARLTMSDINPTALQRCVDEFSVTTCDPEEIYDVDGDVFAPCALGAVINFNTIKRLSTPIIVGSANNQLAHHQYGAVLHEHNILYAPDFVVNAGGLIYAAAMYDHADVTKATAKVSDIYQTILEIFERAKSENCSTSEVAEKMALEKLR